MMFRFISESPVPNKEQSYSACRLSLTYALIQIKGKLYVYNTGKCSRCNIIA